MLAGWLLRPAQCVNVDRPAGEEAAAGLHGLLVAGDAPPRPAAQPSRLEDLVQPVKPEGGPRLLQRGEGVGVELRAQGLGSSAWIAAGLRSGGSTRQGSPGWGDPRSALTLYAGSRPARVSGGY